MKYISLVVGLLLALEYTLIHQARSSEHSPTNSVQVAEMDSEDDPSSPCDDDTDDCQFANFVTPSFDKLL